MHGVVYKKLTYIHFREKHSYVKYEKVIKTRVAEEEGKKSWVTRQDEEQFAQVRGSRLLSTDAELHKRR